MPEQTFAGTMNSFNMTAILRPAENENVQLANLPKNHRTRHEGSLYQKRGMEGSMRDILNLELRPPKPPAKPPAKKKETKNYAQENMKRIRQLSVQRQQSGHEKVTNKPVRASWAGAERQPVVRQNGSRQNVGSTNPLQRSRTSEARPRQVTLEKRTASGVNLHQDNKRASNLKKSASVILPTEERKESGKMEKDFVKLNHKAVKEVRPVRSRSTSNLRKGAPKELDDVPKAKTGEVPQYLVERKAEWKEGQTQAETEAKKPKLPPGCYIMDELERTNLLKELQQTKEKKELEMFRLPLRSDTLRVRKKREELDQALTEIEEGLNILSKPTVIVQQGDYKSPQATPAKTSVLNSTLPKRSSSGKKPAWNKGAVDRSKSLVAAKNFPEKAKEQAEKPRSLDFRGYPKFIKRS